MKKENALLDLCFDDKRIDVIEHCQNNINYCVILVSFINLFHGRRKVKMCLNTFFFSSI